MKLPFLTALAALFILGSDRAFAERPSETIGMQPTECLVAFSRLCELPVSDQKIAASLPQSSNGTSVSLRTLGTCAVKLRLPLRVLRLDFNGIKKHGGFAILHLHSPDRLTIIEAIGTSKSLVYNNGDIVVVNNSWLSGEYAGDVLFLTSSTANSSRVSVDNPVYVLPTNRHGEPIKDKVVFKNEGLGVLTLDMVSKSCSCTQVAPKSQFLAPGQSGALSFTVAPGGSPIVLIDVKTNDPLRPHIIIGLQSPDLQAPEVKASQLTLVGTEGMEESYDVDVFVPDHGTIVKASTRSLSVNITRGSIEAVDGKVHYRVQINMRARPQGEFSDTLTLVFNNTEPSKLELPITGIVEAEIQVIPPKLFLGTISQGEISHRSIVLQSRTHRLFTIKSISCQDAKISVDFAPNTPTTYARLNIAIVVDPVINSFSNYHMNVLLFDGRIIDIPLISHPRENTIPL